MNRSMNRSMNRERLEATVWRALRPGTKPIHVVEEILRAADVYARREAGRILADREHRIAAGDFPPDDPGLTLYRRRELALEVARSYGRGTP